VGLTRLHDRLLSNFLLNKMSKKVMGRPKIGMENARGILIAARFTQGESKQINGKAKQLGLTKSQFVRKVLLSAVSNVDCHT